MNTTHTLDVIDDVDLMIYEFDGVGPADLGVIAFSGHTRGMEPVAFTVHTGAPLPAVDEAALA
jgi:hypothetical protein